MIAAEPSADLLFPLSHFCLASGHPLPACEFIDSALMPEPYRSLLVHHGDMTSRLEEFYRAPMTLRVLHRETSGDACRREVLLCKADDALPVEYGAIEINLAAFDEPLRGEILAGHLPLGGLLNRHGVRYRSEPRGFLKLAPDSAMDAHFALDDAHVLYGRSNMLLGDGERVLARIVEVLRP